MMKVAVFACLLSAVSAYAPVGVVTSRPNTKLHESFGFDFAEDTYKNQPDVLGGEQTYKQWINNVEEENMLNRKYNVIRRVREKKLLTATADAGILSKLDDLGLDLAKVEELLPLAEKLGLLSLAGKNQQLLVNGVAPLLVEPAPLLLPVISGALGVGPGAFYLGAVGAFGLDAFLFANDVEIPFVGLSAGVFLGLVLIPLGAISGAAGVAFSGLKK